MVKVVGDTQPMSKIPSIKNNLISPGTCISTADMKNYQTTFFEMNFFNEYQGTKTIKIVP